MKNTHDRVLSAVAVPNPEGGISLHHFVKSGFPLYRLKVAVSDKMLLRALQPLFAYGTLYVKVDVLTSEGYATGDSQLVGVLLHQPLEVKGVRIATRFGEHYIAINPAYLSPAIRKLPVYTPSVW